MELEPNVDSNVDSGEECPQQSNGISKKQKRSPKEPTDAGKPKKKKIKPVIRNFVHHVCSPISNGKRRRAVAAILDEGNNFDKSELDEVWKGMFFVVWYTEVTKCEEILYDIAYGCRYQNEKDYILAGFKLLAREWMGIDYFRVDKYALLARHMINRSLRITIFESEPRDFDLLNEIFIVAEEAIELFNHILEIYLEELQNVTKRQAIWTPEEKCDVYVSALRPIIKSIPRNTDKRALNTAQEFIFQELESIFESECESRWRNRFFQEMFKELIDTGKQEDILAKNRKFLYEMANRMKELC